MSQIVVDANRSPRNLDPSLVYEALEPLVEACSSTLSGLHLIWRTWVLPNEGYNEEHFDKFIERWQDLATVLGQGLRVSQDD